MLRSFALLFTFLSGFSLVCFADDATYVARLYKDVLHRAAAPEEIQSWTGKLAAGTSAEDVARGFVDSIERRREVIDRDVERYLRRAPLYADESDGLLLFGQGASREDIDAIILSSPEYAFINGNNAMSVAQALFADLFQRMPNENELIVLEIKLHRMPTRSVAYELLNGEAYRTALVSSWYRYYLRREPDVEGLRTWMNELAAGKSWESVQVGILGSQEYRALAR